MCQSYVLAVRRSAGTVKSSPPPSNNNHSHMHMGPYNRSGIFVHCKCVEIPRYLNLYIVSGGLRITLHYRSMTSLVHIVTGGWRRFAATVTRSNKPRLDVDLLENFKRTCASLDKIAITPTHPIYDIAVATRNIVKSEVHQDSGTVSMAILKAELFLKEQSQQFDPSIISINELPVLLTSVVDKERQETSMRISFTRQYLARLKKLQEEKDLDEEAIRTAIVKGLSDTVMLGSASERIVAHVAMFGPAMTQDRFQVSMYAVLEPEVDTCLSALNSISSKTLDKKNRKKAVKIARTFLLDVNELNMKVRSIMAWSDPKYSGFAPVDDHVTATVQDLMITRRHFFGNDTDTIATQFATELVKDRNEFYNERTENRETLLKGIIFFTATCLTDWGLWAI